MALRSKPLRVGGRLVPQPRFTRHAALYFFGLVAGPILALGLALDAILYFVLRDALGGCYAIFCLFGG